MVASSSITIIWWWDTPRDCWATCVFSCYERWDHEAHRSRRVGNVLCCTVARGPWVDRNRVIIVSCTPDADCGRRADMSQASCKCGFYFEGVRHESFIGVDHSEPRSARLWATSCLIHFETICCSIWFNNNVVGHRAVSQWRGRVVKGIGDRCTTTNILRVSCSIKAAWICKGNWCWGTSYVKSIRAKPGIATTLSSSLYVKGVFQVSCRVGRLYLSVSSSSDRRIKPCYSYWSTTRRGDFPGVDGACTLVGRHFICGKCEASTCAMLHQLVAWDTIRVGCGNSIGISTSNCDSSCWTDVLKVVCENSFDLKVDGFSICCRQKVEHSCWTWCQLELGGAWPSSSRGLHNNIVCNDAVWQGWWWVCHSVGTCCRICHVFGNTGNKCSVIRESDRVCKTTNFNLVRSKVRVCSSTICNFDIERVWLMESIVWWCNNVCCKIWRWVVETRSRSHGPCCCRYLNVGLGAYSNVGVSIWRSYKTRIRCRLSTMGNVLRICWGCNFRDRIAAATGDWYRNCCTQVSHRVLEGGFDFEGDRLYSCCRHKVPRGVCLWAWSS